MNFPNPLKVLGSKALLLAAKKRQDANLKKKGEGYSHNKVLLAPALIWSIEEKITDRWDGKEYYKVEFDYNWGVNFIEKRILKRSSRGRRLVKAFEKEKDGPMDESE